MSETAFTINGKKVSVQVHPFSRLLDVIRESLKLTGTKEGCGEGECGACSVMIDGELVNSCLVPIAQVQGKKITTIEGIAKKGMHPLQKSFLKCGGAQCGICTPGMVVASYARTLQKKKMPAKEWLGGNLCRCTGYVQILESLKKAKL